MTTTKKNVPLPAFPLTGKVAGAGASGHDADPDHSRVKILIVDESRFFRTVLINALAPFRLTNIVEANSGEEALEILRTDEIGMVLIDYEMPGKNGTDVVRRIRWSEDEGINARVPIIMISDFTEMAVVLEAANAGVDAMVGKPVIPSELYKKMRSTLGSPREFIIRDDYRGPDRD